MNDMEVRLLCLEQAMKFSCEGTSAAEVMTLAQIIYDFVAKGKTCATPSA